MMPQTFKNENTKLFENSYCHFQNDNSKLNCK